MTISRVRVAKVPWDSQPQDFGQLDLSNPLLNDVAIVSNSAIKNFNLVDGRMFFTNSTSEKYYSDVIGQCFSVTADSSRGARVSSGDLLLNGSSATKGTSILVVANPFSKSAVGMAFSILGGAEELYFIFNSDKTVTASPGDWSVANVTTDGATCIGVVDGNPHVFICTMAGAGTTPNLYVDGVEKGTSKTTMATLFSSPARPYIGGFSGVGFGCSGYGIALVVAVNREWSPEEVKELSLNPWQIFSRQQLSPVVQTIVASAYYAGTEASMGSWTAHPSGTLASCINETIASDAEWIEGVIGTNTPDFPWDPTPVGPGTYDFPVRAQIDTGTTGQIRSVFLDGPGGATLTTGDWHPLTNGYAEYTDNITLASTSTHFRLETQV